MAEATPPAGSPEPAGTAAGTPPATPVAAPPADPKTVAPPPAVATPPAAPPEKDAAEKKGQDKPAGSFLADAAKPDETKDSEPKGTDAYELAMPEGVTADKPLLENFTVKAKELGLTKAQAQALADVAVARAQENAKAQAEEAAKVAAENRKALEAHPDIGGARLEESTKLAKNAVVGLDRDFKGLGSRLVEKLGRAGFGDDPDIAHLLTIISQRKAEDRSPGGAPSHQNANVTQAERRLAARFPSIKGIQPPGK